MNLKAQLIAIGVALATGFSAGWLVNGWRLTGEISRLQGVVDTQVQSIATLEGANKSCVAGVGEVKAAVKGFVDQADKRSKAAEAAMRRAAQEASGHLAAAKDALSRPPAPAGKECDTAAAEATAYAKKRKGRAP